MIPDLNNASPIQVTFFENSAASAKHETTVALQALVDLIATASARQKTALPWLKLALFGDTKTERGSLRHNENVRVITGVEGDYDGELVSCGEACEILLKAGVGAIVYTSPSHTEDAPRWRILAPLSTTYPSTQRDKFMARLNGLFGGIFSAESWTLSQSYYYGSVDSTPSHRVQMIVGTPIDLMDELDDIAIARPQKPSVNGAERPASTGAEEGVSDTRLEGFRVAVLGSLRQQAVDGQKHFALLRHATTLGGIQAAAGFSDAQAWQWLKDCLPASVLDWDAAERTALDGLTRGRAKPITLEDRPCSFGNELLHDGNPHTAHRANGANEAPEPPSDEEEQIHATAGHAEAGKPTTIKVEPGQIDVLATMAETALIAAGLPVFQRGGALVRPAAWSVPASDERTTMAAGLLPVTQPALVDLMAQAATWTRYNGRRKKHCPIDPPMAVAAVLTSRRGFWRVPGILGVITTPTMRRDGSILVDPGFDPRTRLFHLPDPDLRLAPIGSSRAEAERALSLMEDLLTGFPFVTDTDRSVGLSGLISPCVRGAVGAVPAHALSAPTPGSGKSYFVDVAAAIITGRACPVASAGRNEEETEKRLAGLLLAGFPVISLDNMSDVLGGDLLCQAAERPIIRLRPLGRPDIVEIETSATIFTTGNNLIIAGDMARRTLLALLDAHMERPEERQFSFDPVQRVISDRGVYVAACLTIVRAYMFAGCPGKLPQLASFGAWSDLVRSALVWLGRSDPVASIQEVRRGDPVLDTLRQVLEAWRRCFGDEGQTARRVAAAVAGFDPNTAEGEAFLALRAALASVAAERGQIDASKLGYWLRKNKGRIVGGLKFEIIGTSHGLTEWAATH